MLKNVTTKHDNIDHRFKKSRFIWNTENTSFSVYRARPNTSPGYWTSILLPLAMLTNFLPYATNTTTISQSYTVATILAVGMFLETLIFFLKMMNIITTGHTWSLIMNQIPTILSAIGLKIVLLVSWWKLLFFAKIVTWIYKVLYANVMTMLPNSFTYGEGCILVQGLLTFLLSGLSIFLDALQQGEEQITLTNQFDKLNVIMMLALLWLFIMCFLLTMFKSLRQTLPFWILLCIYAVCATCLPLTNPLPIIIVAQYIFKDYSKLITLLLYLGLVSFTIFIVKWQMNRNEKATSGVRKIFHIVLVLVYVPGILWECTLLYLASGIAFAIMAIAELLRVCRISPFNNILETVFCSFADNKDSGLLAVTPFTLLIGFCMPQWLHVQPCCSQQYTAITGTALNRINTNILQLLAGVLTVGFGDTAASIVGSNFGIHKWPGRSRTIEGSLAFCIATYIPILVLTYFGYTPDYTILEMLFILLVIIVCALIEAHTTQIDNLVLPLICYILLNCINQLHELH